MAKYLSISSFPLFSIQLHQHMLTLGLDSCYYNVLSRLTFYQFYGQKVLHMYKDISTLFRKFLLPQNELL